MDRKFSEQLLYECSHIGIELTNKQVEQFYRYYELLIEWNQVMNLTAITEMSGVVTKHFVDSISLNRVLDNFSGRKDSLIDVGTGAGFPGIPLKIIYPELHVTLLDSLNKRVKFLNEVIAQLGLIDIRAVHGRAEDYGRDGSYRECFDICVSRAVANIATLSEYCLPFVRVGGRFISYKSGKIEDELVAGKHAIFLLGGKHESTVLFQLDNQEIERSFVMIEKKETMSKKYPRKAGLPSKEPLM